MTTVRATGWSHPLPEQPEQPTGATSGERRRSTAAVNRWKAAYAFVEEHIAADPEACHDPVLLSAAAHLLAATALTTVADPAALDPAVPDRHEHPSALSRAIAFIEAHPGQPVTVADIAGAAFVSERAVQLAFRRRLDTTPMAYLRRVRLDRAHTELIAADPARTSVTEVATRWGFTSSRFSRHYLRAYGELPSRTLSR